MQRRKNSAKNKRVKKNDEKQARFCVEKMFVVTILSIINRPCPTDQKAEAPREREAAAAVPTEIEHLLPEKSVLMLLLTLSP
jgi:hypothetical protein